MLTDIAAELRTRALTSPDQDTGDLMFLASEYERLALELAEQKQSDTVAITLPK
ncbi:hypothetical protein [Sphingomonas japonica]|uniref:Uncharacterized protein n=1 Tax=Sphingomonas japonica TaxID=511662 RepID=A0ABX0U310_9SPHN|nr:hypothetical protein [Sphingomonas japonica]NIJ23162.1 hypothetical protein [Sphingomonas japonica]